jgi:hypothetical protein
LKIEINMAARIATARDEVKIKLITVFILSGGGWSQTSSGHIWIGGGGGERRKNGRGGDAY